MKRPAILALAGAVALAACDGFKEAMSAHTDVVARAGGQELSVTRLSELLGNSKIPLQKDFAKALGRALKRSPSISPGRPVESENTGLSGPAARGALVHCGLN